MFLGSSAWSAGSEIGFLRMVYGNRPFKVFLCQGVIYIMLLEEADFELLKGVVIFSTWRRIKCLASMHKTV